MWAKYHNVMLLFSLHTFVTVHSLFFRQVKIDFVSINGQGTWKFYFQTASEQLILSQTEVLLAKIAIF